MDRVAAVLNCPEAPWWDSTVVGLIGTAVIAVTVFYVTRHHERSLARDNRSELAAEDIQAAAIALGKQHYGWMPSDDGWYDLSRNLEFTVMLRTPAISDEKLNLHILETSDWVTQTFPTELRAAQNSPDTTEQEDRRRELLNRMRAELARLIKTIAEWRRTGTVDWPPLVVSAHNSVDFQDD